MNVKVDRKVGGGQVNKTKWLPSTLVAAKLSLRKCLHGLYIAYMQLQCEDYLFNLPLKCTKYRKQNHKYIQTVNV